LKMCLEFIWIFHYWCNRNCCIYVIIEKAGLLANNWLLSLKEFCFSRYFCWALKRRTALSITCECCLLLVFLRLVLNLQNSFLLLLRELRSVGRQVGRSQEHVWLDWKWFP
jgi:hypothetical protein